MNAAGFSPPSCGSRAQEPNGDCCPRSTATGTPFTAASHVGRNKESSSICIQPLAGDAELEHLLIDSTIIRAHPSAAGARKKWRPRGASIREKSRRLSTKIHIAVDALGNPLHLLLTAGQCHDSPQAARLIEGYEPQALIADKGYYSDALIQAVTAKGIEAVIPPKKNQLVQREYDQHLYRERHLIECFINKIKQYRRVFSRFEKLSKKYLGFLSFVSALVWLR